MSNIIIEPMKSEPKIEEIKITKKQHEELKTELKKTITTTESRNRIIKKYAGGVCSSLSNCVAR